MTARDATIRCNGGRSKSSILLCPELGEQGACLFDSAEWGHWVNRTRKKVNCRVGGVENPRKRRTGSKE